MDGRQAGSQTNLFYAKPTNHHFLLFPLVGPYPNPCCCLHGACKYCITTNASWSLTKHHQCGKYSLNKVGPLYLINWQRWFLSTFFIFYFFKSWSIALSPRLEYSGAIIAHCSLESWTQVLFPSQPPN